MLRHLRVAVMLGLNRLKLDMKRHKITVGDVYAVPTEGGTGYIQCGAVLNDGCALIRILPGLYDERPELDELCEQTGLVWLLFPVSLYLGRKHIQFIGVHRAPASPKRMLQQKLGPGSYVVTVVDGTMHYAHSETIALADEEAQKLPDYRMPNCPFLQLTMLRLNGLDPKPTVLEPVRQDLISHYLYFSKQGDAKKLAAHVKTLVTNVSISLGKTDGKRPFSLTVNDLQTPLDPERLSGILTEASSNFKGEYDGFEMAKASQKIGSRC